MSVTSFHRIPSYYRPTILKVITTSSDGGAIQLLRKLVSVPSVSCPGPKAPTTRPIVLILTALLHLAFPECTKTF